MLAHTVILLLLLMLILCVNAHAYSCVFAPAHFCSYARAHSFFLLNVNDLCSTLFGIIYFFLLYYDYFLCFNEVNSVWICSFPSFYCSLFSCRLTQFSTNLFFSSNLLREHITTLSIKY